MIRPRIAVKAEVELYKYQKHPLLGKRYGPNLAVVAVEVDKGDVFGLGKKHYVVLENSDGKEAYVDTLAEAIADIKKVYSDAHIYVKLERNKMYLSFYAQPKQES